MANISITLNGIDDVISNLNYRPGSVKYKAIKAIRANYETEATLRALPLINTDAIIQTIWDVGDDPLKIKSKHRNFHILKSSINSDLERLGDKDLNPENIYISKSNVFDMTAEAKNQLLSSYSDALQVGDVDLTKADGFLKVFSEFLKNLDNGKDFSDPEFYIDQIKKMSEGLSQTAPDDSSFFDDNPSASIDTKTDQHTAEEPLTGREGFLAEKICLQVKELPENLQNELLNTIRAWQYGKNREFQRRNVNLEIDVLIDSHVIQTNMKDISANGVLLQTREHIELDKTVRMVFSIPGTEKPFKLEGRVVRSTESGIAVKFNEVSPYFTSILNEAIWRE